MPRRLDPAGLINYLNFGSVYDPITMIKGVFALEAGHYACGKTDRYGFNLYRDLAPNGPSKTPLSYLAGKKTARKEMEDDVTPPWTSLVACKR